MGRPRNTQVPAQPSFQTERIQYVAWSLIEVATVVAVVNVLLSIPVMAAFAWVVAGADTFARSQPAAGVVN